MAATVANHLEGQTLKEFQIAPLSISQKADIEFGKKIAQHINSTVQQGVNTGYYFLRNQRYRTNREWASGTINIQAMFQDLLEMNGKVNYVNLNWSSIKLANRIISGLVGRWMGKREKILVTAKDSLSLKDKKDQYDELEFQLFNRRQLEQLEQESGQQLIPRDSFIPADTEELNLWVTGFQKLPEEICYELGCNDVLEANGFFDTNKEKALHDSAETGFVGTYTEMDENGVVRVDRVMPENAIYSNSDYDDFRDTSWRGRVTSPKVSEIRRKYGVEYGGKLTEQQLFEIASTACEYNRYDKITWVDEYMSLNIRPYDEWNIDVIEFELRSVDSEPYTEIETKKNKSTILKKGKPQKKGDNETVLNDTKVNIWRGVFARNNDIMLEWGLKKNMIRPNDPKEVGNAEFSYSFYMPQNFKMRNLAVPEKIEEPLQQMILIRLKMQQLISKMTPVGAAINVDALQELDLGLASGMTSPIEAQKIYEQTGRMYYRGRDGEGNPIPIPIQELANAGFLNQMNGLIAMYQFHYQVLKDELGEDPALIQQALQPRVSSGNINTAQEVAENATDYFYSAYRRCMEDTAKKISCLLKKSVVYGSNAYRAIIQPQDVSEREFSATIKMLPDQMEIAKFEAFLNQGIASNPDLILFIDPFQLMRLAKEDVKLAETLFRQGQKKMLLHQMQTASKNAQENAQIQAESMKASEEAKRETAIITERAKGEVETALSKEKQKEIILTGIFSIYSKGVPVPSELKVLETEIIKNTALPLFQENLANEMAMVDAMGQMEGQEQPIEEQPQQQVA